MGNCRTIRPFHCSRQDSHEGCQTQRGDSHDQHAPSRLALGASCPVGAQPFLMRQKEQLQMSRHTGQFHASAFSTSSTFSPYLMKRQSPQNAPCTTRTRLVSSQCVLQDGVDRIPAYGSQLPDSAFCTLQTVQAKLGAFILTLCCPFPGELCRCGHQAECSKVPGARTDTKGAQLLLRLSQIIAQLARRPRLDKRACTGMAAQISSNRTLELCNGFLARWDLRYEAVHKVWQASAGLH